MPRGYRVMVGSRGGGGGVRVRSRVRISVSDMAGSALG